MSSRWVGGFYCKCIYQDILDHRFAVLILHHQIRFLYFNRMSLQLFFGSYDGDKSVLLLGFNLVFNSFTPSMCLFEPNTFEGVRQQGLGRFGG